MCRLRESRDKTNKKQTQKPDPKRQRFGVKNRPYGQFAVFLGCSCFDLQILLILAENFWETMTEKKQKKRVAISYKNLSPELRDEVKKQYPNGYTDHMIRIDKGPGDFFYAIVLETEDTSYLIKVDVKADDQVEEDDKDFFGEDEIKDDDEIIDTDMADMDDEE